YPWLERNKSHHRIQTGFYVIRAIVVALIFSAVVSVAESTFLREGSSFGELIQSGENISSLFNLSAILMFVVSLLALMKFKIHPIIVILGSGVVGVIWFILFPQLF
ncbi:MAG: chromate transporter, partial [Turicibacter sp.]